MEYTINHNSQYNSTEIFFNGKPSQEIRETLKAMKFRWHGQKKCWYGRKSEEEIRAVIENKPAANKIERKTEKAEPVNKYGVKVGDVFRSSWGYEQTNNDFFQVVELIGSSSVRVREVDPPMIEEDAIGPMSEDRTFQISGEMLPASSFSVFIKDQEKGDIKRLKSYAADGVSNPHFKLSSFTKAWLVPGGSVKVYESWYA